MTTGTPGAGRPPTAAQRRRASVERRSAVLVVYLSGRRRVAVAAAPLALLVGLAFARGPVALVPGLLLLALVSWLAYLSWPHVTPPQRALRLLVAAVVAAVTVAQLRR